MGQAVADLAMQGRHVHILHRDLPQPAGIKRELGNLQGRHGGMPFHSLQALIGKALAACMAVMFTSALCLCKA